MQAIARLHVLAARGIASDDDLGRPRVDEAVAGRLSGLADLIAGRKTSSALLLAAVVHGELLALEAFEAGNDLVARAAGRLVLVARGLDPKAVSSPDVGHWRAARTGTRTPAARTGPEMSRRGSCTAVRRRGWGRWSRSAICEAIVRTAEAQA